MKKRGISLIVLIVTIIVIIILAAVVILTISKNNPIESAKEATFKEDVRTFQDELAMYISKDYTNKAGQRDEKVTATNYNPAGDPASVYTYIPSFSKKYEGKFVIKNDELMYKEEMLQQEKDWCQSLNVKENAKTGAEKAKEDPQNYYGAKVKYTAPNGVNDWKIFYSDGSNVYIITSDYIDPQIENQLPSKDGARPNPGDIEGFPKGVRFNIISKYNGSSDITDEKMKALNSDYFAKGYTSGNNTNMKVVAYMLDKDIWSELYVDEIVAEYAVGGPSVELLIKSYCITHPEKKDLYKTQTSSDTGYQVSANGGTSWSSYIVNGMLSTSDHLYVLPQSSGAKAMWLASPSDYSGIYVLYVYHSGGSLLRL